MQCAICYNLDLPAHKMQWVAIKCGHVFCEPCLTTAETQSRQRANPFTCPTCRQLVKKEDIWKLYPEFDQSNDTQTSPLVTNEDIQEVATILDVADDIGLESSSEKLAAVIFKAEKWIVSLPSSDHQLQATLQDIFQVLRQLRNRLVYSKRLESVKEAHRKLVVEHHDLTGQCAELRRKYDDQKRLNKRLFTKYTEAREKAKNLALADQQWRERDSAQKELIQTLQLKDEGTISKIASLRNAAEESSQKAARLNDELNGQNAKIIKWKKKYFAAKKDADYAQTLKMEIQGADHDYSLIVMDESDKGT